MSTILETQNLSKSFGKRQAVDSVCLHVPEKSIYGFLGPNGAGKTTTIRMILGLIQPNDGDIAVFGKNFAEHRPEILKEIGSLVENPSLYSHLTGYENLKVACMHYGLPQTRIEETLELVNIKDRMNDRVGQYSLGMKQRLALALALIHRPKLVILDEPTNGLDPIGIKEMRLFLKDLPQKIGATVFLSSHLLSEVEQICDHVGIINEGKLVFEGTMEDLKNQSQSQTIFTVSNAQAAKKILADHPAKFEDNKIYFDKLNDEKIAKLNSLLVSHGINVFEIIKEKSTLEDTFFNLTSKEGI